MNIEQINELWAADCGIDRNKLTEETLRSANLHQKYLELLMQCKSKLIKLSSDYLELKELKTRYYNGELTQEELQENNLKQYQGLKPLKSTMGEKLDGDSDIIKLKLKIQYMENMQYQLESILQQIKGRDWGIKNHIEYLKFVAGT
jgi:hypothetical protein